MSPQGHGLCNNQPDYPPAAMGDLPLGRRQMLKSLFLDLVGEQIPLPQWHVEPFRKKVEMCV